MSKTKFTRRIRDAYRLLRGKPPKQFQMPLIATDDLLLTDRDIVFVKDRLAACHPAAQLVVIGNDNTRITACCVLACNDRPTTQILLNNCQRPADQFTHAIAVTTPERWKVIPTDDAASELLQLRDDTPEVVVINACLSESQLKKVLRIASEIGVTSVVGWCNEISMFSSMQIVHEYQTTDNGDYLWEALVSLDKRYQSDNCSVPSNAARIAHDANSCVSIVIPVFNARPFISEALGDIEKQTYADWEVVLVDDGSPEPIDDIISSFKDRWPSKRVVLEKKARNEGVSAARNDGMALTNGMWIAFLDADDRWTPNHLSRKISVLQSSRADLVYSAVEMFDDPSGQRLYNLGPTAEERAFFPDSLLSRNFIQPSGVIIRRRLYELHGGFNQSISIGEDYDYWLRVLRHGSTFVYDPQITTRYRKNHAVAATTNRMVLCYDNVARIAMQFSDLVHDERLRKFLMVRHLMTAGLGHLSYSSRENFGSNTSTGRDLIRLASNIDPTHEDVRHWLKVANLAIETKSTYFFKPIFRKQFKKYCSRSVSFRELKNAA